MKKLIINNLQCAVNKINLALHNKTWRLKQIKKQALVLALSIGITYASGSTISVSATSTKLTANTMAIGSYAQFGSYYGKPIIWRVINKDSNGTLIFMDKIISVKAFDSNGDLTDGRGNADRTSYGSNYWEKSNLRDWLNSTSTSNVTYSSQKPDASHVSCNAYDTEPGFLSNFTINERNAIQSVTRKSIVSTFDQTVANGGTSSHTYNSTNPPMAIQNYDLAYYKATVDNVFPLSVKELNDYVYNNTELGNGTTYWQSVPTADAISHTTYTSIDPPFDTSHNWYYWLRDAYADNSSGARDVVPAGSIYGDGAYAGFVGLRGALYLKSNLAISGGSGTSVNPYTFFGVTTIASPLLDQYNNGDARDIRVIFNGTADESYVKEYRIMAVRTGIAGAFNTTAALALPSDSYAVKVGKGKNRQHLFNLPQALRDSEGNAITGGTSYTIFVLAVGKTGCSNTLTPLGTIMLDTNNQGAKVEAAAPFLMDVANNNNGTDLRVTFRKSKSEANIQEYRIIASTANLDLTAANNVPVVGYKVVTPTNPRSNYVMTLGSLQTDQGGTAAIQNGTQYKVYVLAVGKNGYNNVLSTASKSMTLSANVPGVPTVRGLCAAHVGEGSDSSNIKVTFYEPVANSNVAEYRIFLVPSANTLDEATAKSVVSGRYQAVLPTRRGALHSVTLDAGLHDYTDAALSTGSYKVYVLTVGKSGSASRLSTASGNVTLP